MHQGFAYLGMVAVAYAVIHYCALKPEREKRSIGMELLISVFLPLLIPLLTVSAIAVYLKDRQLNLLGLAAISLLIVALQVVLLYMLRDGKV